jgi:multidrug efflux system membrane fusion protein
MKTNYLFIIPFIVLTSSCLNKETKEQDTEAKAVKVKAFEVVEKEMAFPLHSSGKLSLKTEQKLSFKTGGIIRKIYVFEGQDVIKGKLLAELNLSEIKAKVNLAEQALAKAERDFKRAASLLEDSVATLEQYQNAKTAMEVAKSNLEIARFNMQYSTISAPSDGRILRRLMEENEVASAGHPVFIFGLTDDNWVVRVNLTDKDIVNISTGDSAIIKFDAYRDYEFKAIVSEIAKDSDPYTGTYEVELALQRVKDKKLVSGFIAKVDIISGKLTGKYISVPIDALADCDEMTGYVFEISDSTVHRKKIEFVKILSNEVLLNKGLAPGTKIVTEGINYLNDNSKIIIVE